MNKKLFFVLIIVIIGLIVIIGYIYIKKPVCGECSYLENYICKDYICCNDIDCNDDDFNTKDECINPKTINSKCENILMSKIDCEFENYKMAFILVESSENLHISKDINKINLLKLKTAETFTWATKGLAFIDTSYPIVILRLEKNPSKQEILKKFYEKNPDDFHFITIFSTYDDSGDMHHIIVRNNIKGIGLSIFDNTDDYGSDSKLLGVNWMEEIDSTEIDDFSLILNVNGILHETSHQWGAYIDFIDENGQKSNSLRNPYNMAHWDKKLETGYDLLNGFSWKDNGDGTFTAKTVVDYRNGYSDLDLYLMGLLSKDEVDPVTLIVSGFDTKDIQPGTIIRGVAENILIHQIIDVEGERVCIITNK